MAQDRHDRARRADTSLAHRPSMGFRARDRARFRQLVADAVASLPAELRRHLAEVPVQVADVPAVPSAHGAVTLCEARAVAGRLEQVVVYRRPLELRAQDRLDLVDRIADALAVEVADALGLPPPDPDPRDAG